MESVYKASAREWISERVCIEDHFKEFREAFHSAFISDLTEEGRSYDSSTSNSPRGSAAEGGVTAAENELLKDYCSHAKLKCPGEMDRLDLTYYMSRMRRQLSSNPALPKDELPSLKTLKYLRKQKSKHYLKYTRTIWLNEPAKPIEEVSRVREDLQVSKDYMIIIKIYDPYDYTVRDVRHVHCGKQYMFLPNQTLSTVRDQITCLNDLNIPTDVSDNPDQLPAPVAKDVFKASFIYIEGTFYIDCPDGDGDPSQEVRDWASEYKIGEMKTAAMSKTQLKTLSIRFGYPYVFQHQGDCEHLVIFNDARFINNQDPKHSEQYPVFMTTDTKKDRKCYMCGRLVARWATVNSNRVANDPFYWCDECFRSYNYKDGEKIGNFRAFSVTDKCVQLV